MNNNPNIIIKKIHLKSFIDMLSDIYDIGIEYIDINAISQEHQDLVGISYSTEYLKNDSTFTNKNDNFEEDFNQLV
jgi:hypothetical protein